MELTLSLMVKKSRFYLLLAILSALPLVFHHGGYIVKNILSALILSIVVLSLVAHYNKTLHKVVHRVYRNTFFKDVKSSVYISKAMFIVAKVIAILHSGEILLILGIIAVTGVIFKFLSKFLNPFRFRTTFVFIAGLNIAGLLPGDIVQMFNSLYDKEYKELKEKKEKNK